MAKLTEKEREAFEKILAKDLGAIDEKFMNQIKDFWDTARKEVMKSRGWDLLMLEKESLQKQQEEIIGKIHKIESTMNKVDLKPEQIVELGGNPDDYGRYRGANLYGIPVTSQFEYDIVEYIRSKINIEVPAKVLRDICESAIRALTMSGTFEEARDAYNKFYSLDFRKYGVNIPPRLDDITKNKKLIAFAQDSLNQVEDKKVIEIGDSSQSGRSGK